MSKGGLRVSGSFALEINEPQHGQARIIFIGIFTLSPSLGEEVPNCGVSIDKEPL